MRTCAISFVSIMLAVLGCLFFTYESQKQTEQKFCDVINTVVDAYRSSAAPTTPLGVRLKTDYLILAERLGCVGK